MVNIPDQERRTRYSPSTPTSVFPVGFPIVEAADLQIWIGGELLDASGWSVTLGLVDDGFYSNAFVTLDTPVDDVTVDVLGARRPQRVGQYQEGAGVPASRLNHDANVDAIERRETYDRLNRAIVVAPGAPLTELPPPLAKRILVWSNDASKLENGPAIDDLVGEQGPQGPKGDTGPVGPAGSGSGDVIKPVGGSTDHAIPRFDGAGGSQLLDSGVTISDDDALGGFTNRTGPAPDIVTGAAGDLGDAAAWDEDGNLVPAPVDQPGGVLSYKALLLAIGSLTMVEDGFIYGGVSGVPAIGTVTALGRTLLAGATASVMRGSIAAAAKSQTLEALPLYLKNVENETVEKVFGPMPHAGTLTITGYTCKSGSATFQWRKRHAGTSAAMGDALAVTTAESVTGALSLTWAAGDYIGYQVSANAACAGLAVMGTYTRALV